MRPGHAALWVLLSVPLLAGCATPYGKARAALLEGRYEDAASRFEAIVARQPDRVDALVGLGKARYKLGAFDGAIAALTRAVTQAPGSETVRLYLGLAHLRKGEDGPAEEHLRALLDLAPHPRMAAQTNRALELLRAGQLSTEMRAFVAASLEHEAEWAREVRAAAAAYPPPPLYWYWYRPFGPCFTTRSGLFVCY